MSTHRVIQDSDESDNEIVPIVAPVTTLQGPSPNASVSMQVDDPTINTPLNFASTIPSEGAASLGLGLPVNFDEFLDSSGSRRESVDSLGNRQVCGEGGEKLNGKLDVT